MHPIMGPVSYYTQEGHPACKNMGGDGGGGHWLVQMEWRPAGWSVCLPLLILPCTIKSRSSLLSRAHPDGPGKRAVKRLWCSGGDSDVISSYHIYVSCFPAMMWASSEKYLLL